MFLPEFWLRFTKTTFYFCCFITTFTAELSLSAGNSAITFSDNAISIKNVKYSSFENLLVQHHAQLKGKRKETLNYLISIKEQFSEDDISDQASYWSYRCEIEFDLALTTELRNSVNVLNNLSSANPKNLSIQSAINSC